MKKFIIAILVIFLMCGFISSNKAFIRYDIYIDEKTGINYIVVVTDKGVAISPRFDVNSGYVITLKEK